MCRGAAGTASVMEVEVPISNSLLESWVSSFSDISFFGRRWSTLVGLCLPSVKVRSPESRADPIRAIANPIKVISLRNLMEAFRSGADFFC